MLTYHANIATTDAITALTDLVEVASATNSNITRARVAFPYADHAAHGFVTVAFDTADEVDADVIGLVLGVETRACLAL